MTPQSLGFIGLGNMGKGMATNLVKAGFNLTVYDIRPEPVKELVKLGAQAGSGPRELAQSCDIVLTSLPTADALFAVSLGKGGILEGARKGLTFAIMDTVLPSTILRIKEKLAAKGVEVVDSPVSGGAWGARDGTLTIMAGGKKKAFDQCVPIFKAIGKEIFYTGKSGSGEVCKLINNELNAANILAMMEGVLLGVKAGVRAKTLQAVISKSTGRSHSIEWRLPNQIAPRKFDMGAPLKVAWKDMTMIADLAQEHHVPLFIHTIVKQMYEAGMSRGLGDRDHTILLTLLEENAGIKLRW